jgi:hypothetical protein
VRDPRRVCGRYRHGPGELTRPAVIDCFRVLPGGHARLGGRGSAAEGVVTDTVVERDTVLAPVVTPVPVAESAAVVTEADIDVDRDTVPLNRP